MSWFSELTSKAEAMLVKLDQDAAQALQDPEKLLKGTKLLDKALDRITSQITTEDPGSISSTDRGQKILSQKDEAYTVEGSEFELHQKHEDEYSKEKDKEQLSEKVPQTFQTETSPEQIDIPSWPSDQTERDRDFASFQLQQTTETIPVNNPTSSGQKNPSTSQIRKFKLRTSKLRTPLANNKLQTAETNTIKRGIAENGSSAAYNNQDEETLASREAADIRASINKSLLEYSTSSTDQNTPYNPQTSYTSHYDSKPNLITKEDSNSYADSLTSDKLSRAHSFSISVPDDGQPCGTNQSSDFTKKLLAHGDLKKKSTFNLHQVINRLANQDGYARPIISDLTRMKLRRAQMRATSYARRVNYYFRAYPTMKYWMLGYIVFMQLLVIYVLFFYQASSSSTYLSSQVKKQQEELTESFQTVHKSRPGF